MLDCFNSEPIMLQSTNSDLLLCQKWNYMRIQTSDHFVSSQDRFCLRVRQNVLGTRLIFSLFYSIFLRHCEFYFKQNKLNLFFKIVFFLYRDIIDLTYDIMNSITIYLDLLHYYITIQSVYKINNIDDGAADIYYL